VKVYPCCLELRTGAAGQNNAKSFRIDRTWRAAPNAKELQQIVELPVDVADHRNRRRDVWHILVGLQDLLGLPTAHASSIYRPTRKHSPAQGRCTHRYRTGNMLHARGGMHSPPSVTGWGPHLLAEAHHLIFEQRIAVHDRGNLAIEVLHHCSVHPAEAGTNPRRRPLATSQPPPPSRPSSPANTAQSLRVLQIRVHSAFRLVYKSGGGPLCAALTCLRLSSRKDRLCCNVQCV
jgi:hypothetical protein